MPSQFLTVYVDNYAAIRASPLVGFESEAETCALLAQSRIAPLTGLDNANCRRPQRAHHSGSTSFWARLIGG